MPTTPEGLASLVKEPEGPRGPSKTQRNEAFELLAKSPNTALALEAAKVVREQRLGNARTGAIARMVLDSQGAQVVAILPKSFDTFCDDGIEEQAEHFATTAAAVV